MKKILAFMLALTFAAVSFFALGLTAFANPAEGTSESTQAAADPKPNDPETPSEKPSETPSETPSEAPSEKPSEKPSEAPSEKPSEAPTEEPAVSGTNNINDPNENNTSASSVAPDDEIPNTGSGIVVPALALLALAGGAAIAVKAKKD